MRGILAVSFSAFVTCASAVEAQPLTFQRSDMPAAGNPRAIATADFNRDGWSDLALAGTERDSIAILLNRGREGPGFALAHDIVVGGGPFDMAAGDLNRDGIMDLAVANADLHAITLLMGNGDGSFDPPRHIAAPGNPRGIALGDLNRDGKTDLAFTVYEANAWRVALGDGAGNFSSAQSYATATKPQGIVTGDFNHDGATDVAVTSTSGTVSVFIRAAPPSFVRRDIPGTGTSLNVITAGDFNRDGWLDLAAASSGNQTVGLYRGGPGGRFVYYATVLTQLSPRGIEAADLNQDGWLDLVTGDRGTSTVTVLKGRPDGSGMFDPIHLAAGGGSRDVALADFDHDGRVDIATANESGDSTTVLHNSTAFVAPSFAFERSEVTGIDGVRVVAAADFNENGKIDILLPGQIVLDGATFGGGIDQFAHVSTIGDFNNDGHVDVAGTNGQDTTRTRVMLGDGRGALTTTGAGPQVTSFITAMAAGDLNGDGRDDLAVATTDFRTSGGVELLLANPDGTLVRTARADTFRSAQVRMADLNRDGSLDVVVAGAGEIAVLIGDGRGGYSSVKTTVHGQDVVGFDLGDVNHDGVLDLATTDQAYPNISALVFLGAGDGTFREPGAYPATLNPGLNWGVQGVTLVDLDHDGHLDVFTSVGGLLRGRGDGSFEEPDEFDMYSDGPPLVVDFNGDGLLDVIGVMDTRTTYWVAMNRRTTANRPPVAVIQDRFEVDYSYFFDTDVEEGGVDGGRFSFDPDFHALFWQWRDQTGRNLGQSPVMFSDFPTGTHTATATVRDMRGGITTHAMDVIVHPFKEMVLLPGWEAFPHGAWQGIEDSSAADDRRLWHPDAGAAKRTTALASPVHYFEIPFLADPTQEYKLWIRLKAQNDRWSNDSVFVQMTGAQDAAGQPVYRRGTTSALEVNLEECVNCGVSGWGWEDDGWGARDVNGVTLRFPEGGVQILRIQTREDGVSIDQIVLSAEKYRTARPGAAKNDNTRLQRVGPYLFHPEIDR